MRIQDCRVERDSLREVGQFPEPVGVLTRLGKRLAGEQPVDADGHILANLFEGFGGRLDAFLDRTEALLADADVPGRPCPVAVVAPVDYVAEPPDKAGIPEVLGRCAHSGRILPLSGAKTGKFGFLKKICYNTGQDESPDSAQHRQCRECGMCRAAGWPGLSGNPAGTGAGRGDIPQGGRGQPPVFLDFPAQLSAERLAQMRLRSRHGLWLWLYELGVMLDIQAAGPLNPLAIGLVLAALAASGRPPVRSRQAAGLSDFGLSVLAGGLLAVGLPELPILLQDAQSAFPAELAPAFLVTCVILAISQAKRSVGRLLYGPVIGAVLAGAWMAGDIPAAAFSPQSVATILEVVPWADLMGLLGRPIG